MNPVTWFYTHDNARQTYIRVQYTHQLLLTAKIVDTFGGDSYKAAKAMKDLTQYLRESHFVTDVT